MKDLYYIVNTGCDDETCGLAIIPKEFFNIFKEIIENLNENSNYSCMPTIGIYKIDENMIREARDDDKDYNILHLGTKKYVLKKKLYDSHNFTKGVEKVI